MSPAPMNNHKTMVVIKTIKQTNTWQIIDFINSINNNSRWLYLNSADEMVSLLWVMVKKKN